MWIICGNTEIILYSAYSNPAFCDLTYTQIFWFYTGFILCNLIMVFNGLTVALGSSYRSIFGYKNKNIQALSLGMVLGSSRGRRTGREILGKEEKLWIKIMESWNGWAGDHLIPSRNSISNFHYPRLLQAGLGHFQGSQLPWEIHPRASQPGIPSQHFFLTPNLTQPILEFFPWFPPDVLQLLVWFGKFLLRRSPSEPRKRNIGWEVLIDLPDLQMKGRVETLCINYGQNQRPKSPGSSGKKFL